MSKTVIQEIHEVQKKQRKDKLANSDFVLSIKGMVLFTEGISLAVVSGFTVYQAYTQSFPLWGQYVLLVASAFVIAPAFILLAKFFKAVGKA